VSPHDFIGGDPGSFDPITNGHVDIIGRATRIVDRLIVAVAANPGKAPLFSLQERCDMLKEQVALMRNGDGTRIEVRAFSELLMNFVEDLGVFSILHVRPHDRKSRRQAFYQGGDDRGSGRASSTNARRSCGSYRCVWEPLRCANVHRL
jgi:cytidyltransferase-like protein